MVDVDLFEKIKDFVIPENDIGEEKDMDSVINVVKEVEKVVFHLVILQKDI